MLQRSLLLLHNCYVQFIKRKLHVYNLIVIWIMKLPIISVPLVVRISHEKHFSYPPHTTMILSNFFVLSARCAFNIPRLSVSDPKLQLQSGYRSELQESALVVSLQMFNLILERCVSLIQEHAAASKQQNQSVPQDVHILLPAVKIWCDWLICHSGVWNPPPSTQDYRVG